MHINRDSWHFKVWQFSRCLSPRTSFYLDYDDATFEPQINVCEYMRQILLWLPIKVFFVYMLPFVIILMNLFVIFFTTKALTGAGMLVMAMVAIFVTSMVFAGVIMLYEYYIKPVKDKVFSKEESFASLYKYTKKTKNKFCAFLEVK